jgi:alpha-glucosidase
MQWEGGPGAGFTDGATPWLPFADDRSVAAQREDPGSTLNLVRDLIALRRERSDLTEGAYETLPDDAWVWRRGSGTVVALNLSDAPVEVEARGTVLIGTHRDTFDGRLEPWEGVVLDG